MKILQHPVRKSVPNRVDFIDWLKAIGMLLIVVGHFFGEPFDQFTQPIYPKQLGVAFFVFVMGWGLANEIRPKWHVVYNRLFPMYFWGFTIALFLSAMYLLFNKGLALTNYLPFLAGINVLTNFFPSNPTTWFIGTYLHILLFWALVLPNVRITKKLIFLTLLFELLVRALWIDVDKLLTGYMLLTNWLTVLLLGMYMKQQKDIVCRQSITFTIAILWTVFLGLWAYLINHYLPLENSFPFKTISSDRTIFFSALISFTVSIVYISNTLLAVALFQRISANLVVRFFSRNTIIIFIAHMPFYEVAEPIARQFVEQGWGKRAIIVLMMYVGLALLSELLHRLINLNQIKAYCYKSLNRLTK